LIVEAFNSMLAAISLAGSHPRDPAIAKMLGGGLTNSAGVKVTVDKILALPAIKRGIQIITDKLFGLPWYVLEINEDGRQYSRNHPAWKCVHWMANPMLSAPSFRQILTQWAMTRGNGCAWIDRSGPSWELYPLNPDETKPIVLGARDAELLEDQSLVGQLRIGTKVGGKPVLLELDYVYHIKGYGQSPYWGADITETMGEVFGEAKEALLATPLGSDVAGFFTVSSSGTCPVFTWNLTYFNKVIVLDMFCNASALAAYAWMSKIVGVLALFLAFRVAFL